MKTDDLTREIIATARNRVIRALLRNANRSIRGLDLLLLIFSCFAAVSVLPAAQSQQPAPSFAQEAQANPSLRVSTRLVQVNVIVNDKHGSPISGLTQQDFSLLDNGKPQEIRLFSMETSAAQSLSRAPLLPSTFTNRPEELTGLPASVTVILLDELNTQAADQTLAREQVFRALQEIQAQEYVALYWLGNGLRILHDFTSDASLLRRVLSTYSGKSSRDLDNSELADPSLDSPNPSTPAGQATERQAFRLAFDQRVANQSTAARVRATVAAMTAIAHHLETRKGRKNLVWVSSSFPISVGYDKFDLNWMNDTGEDFAAEVRRAAKALTDADIAVYPVDARGLLGSNVSATQGGDAQIEGFPGGDEHLPERGAPETLDTMRLLAERTGGEAFYGTNDLAGAIRHALNDSRVTYALGYYPTGVKWDGAFHEIKVKVSTPGAKIRARTGYFAVPDAPVSSPKNDRALISQLASSWLPATGIGLHVRAQPVGTPGAVALNVEVRLDLREIQMLQKGSRSTGTVQSAFLQLDRAGHVLQADDRTFHPDFDAATYERVLQTGLIDTRQVRVLPSAEQLCIVVRDRATGNTGSVYVPLAEYSHDSSGTNRKKE